AFLGLFISFAALAQTIKPEISWEKTSHNFGTFKEEAGLQTAVFEFTNIGQEPLYLTNVKASCGCTATEYTKEPIPSGTKGFVKASYNPQNRPGKFNKTITVTSNCENATTILTISGEVTPREKGVEDIYPKEFSGLRLKNSHLAMNNVKNTEVKTDSLGVVNMSESTMKVTFQNVPAHIKVWMEPAQLAGKKPNEKMGQTGAIYVSYDAKKKNDWGFLQDRVTVVINDSVNSKNKLTISATIVEDFSHLTKEELENAPKIVFQSTEYDFGTIKQGEKVTYEYKFKNEGKSDLIIRKVKATCGCTVPNPEKMVIKAGEESFIKATFNSSGKKGRQSKPITITTNDPSNSSAVLKIIGNIEEPNATPTE
ncbi:MAG: DUF1573 domain-containing protein, partial [Bacteroidales bacterium]|nr:DUF1573 domain-containing protein [Bacteroidales bacterium]